MRIGNRTFGGERPKRDPRNLPEDEALLALDCDLVSSTLRSLKAPSVELEGVGEGVNSMQFFKDKWFTFDEPLNIIEQSDRLFWTGANGSRQATLPQLQSGLSYAMGVPKPDAPAATPVGSNGTGIEFQTFYVVAFVNQFFEEGDKSDISELITVKNGQTVNLTGLGIPSQADPAAADDSGVAKQRIYRLAEGEAKFVAEIPATQTTFSETIGDITLGEVFPSEDFAPPPGNLDGLHLMANGIALGFVPGERLVYVSEPFNANAWPYFFPTEGVPCAISSYDNNAVIVTDSYPEVAAINDPRNIVPTTLTYREPCASARSLVQAEGGVIYASVNGLFYIGRGGGRRITKDHLDFHDWEEYAPSSIIGMYRDKQYIGFHSGLKEGSALVFDMRSGDGTLRQLSQTATAVFVKPGTDQGFVADAGNIWMLEGSEDRLEYIYRSKWYGLGSPFAMNSRRVLSCEQITRSYSPDIEDELPEFYAARAEALAARDALPLIFGIGGAINQHLIAGAPEIVAPALDADTIDYRTINGFGALDTPRTEVRSVWFKLYGDKELVHEEVISDDEAIQRLTYFDRRRLYSYELIGNLDISQIDIAGSNSEMHDGT